eukprot:10392118-Alexandrium_andersonii.AAC.1
MRLRRAPKALVWGVPGGQSPPPLERRRVAARNRSGLLQAAANHSQRCRVLRRCTLGADRRWQSDCPEH